MSNKKSANRLKGISCQMFYSTFGYKIVAYLVYLENTKYVENVVHIHYSRYNFISAQNTRCSVS